MNELTMTITKVTYDDGSTSIKVSYEGDASGMDFARMLAAAVDLIAKDTNADPYIVLLAASKQIGKGRNVQ